MLLGQPALALARIVIGQQMRLARVPTEAESIAKLDAYARILCDIANVAGFHSVLGDEPELLANAPVTNGSTAGLSSFATDGLQ